MKNPVPNDNAPGCKTYSQGELATVQELQPDQLKLNTLFINVRDDGNNNNAPIENTSFMRDELPLAALRPDRYKGTPFELTPSSIHSSLTKTSDTSKKICLSVTEEFLDNKRVAIPSGHSGSDNKKHTGHDNKKHMEIQTFKSNKKRNINSRKDDDSKEYQKYPFIYYLRYKASQFKIDLNSILNVVDKNQLNLQIESDYEKHKQLNKTDGNFWSIQINKLWLLHGRDLEKLEEVQDFINPQTLFQSTTKTFSDECSGNKGRLNKKEFDAVLFPIIFIDKESAKPDDIYSFKLTSSEAKMFVDTGRVRQVLVWLNSMRLGFKATNIPQETDFSKLITDIVTHTITAFHERFFIFLSHLLSMVTEHGSLIQFPEVKEQVIVTHTAQSVIKYLVKIICFRQKATCCPLSVAQYILCVCSYLYLHANARSNTSQTIMEQLTCTDHKLISEHMNGLLLIIILTNRFEYEYWVSNNDHPDIVHLKSQCFQHPKFKVVATALRAQNVHVSQHVQQALNEFEKEVLDAENIRMYNLAPSIYFYRCENNREFSTHLMRWICQQMSVPYEKVSALIMLCSKKFQEKNIVMLTLDFTTDIVTNPLFVDVFETIKKKTNIND